MKNVIVFAMLILASSMVSQGYTDERRWLILLAESEHHPSIQKQLKAIQQNEEAALERKIAVILRTRKEKLPIFNVPKGWKIADFIESVQLGKADFEAILVGLDGGEKMRTTKPISTQDLFDNIDSMPMRQREMKQKQ